MKIKSELNNPKSKNTILQIQNLSVSIENKIVLKDLNLTINQGEIHALMGPNGSGKSSLALFLAGHPRYQEISGSILFNQVNLLNLTPDKRALAGLFVSYQNPISIPGVSVNVVFRSALNAFLKWQKKPTLDIARFYQLIRPIFEKLSIDQKILGRDFNEGFSGGERKKIEAAFFLILKPKLAIFDEIDSGLDIDSVKLIAENIKYSQKSGQAIVFITHYNRILKQINPDFVHILKNGAIQKSGDFKLALEVENNGYKQI